MEQNSKFKRTNTQSLGEVIQQYIRNSGIQPKLDEASIIAKWEEIVGKMIARGTNDLYIKNRKLFIKFNSAALRQEMSYSKTKIVEQVNNAIGHIAIDDVVLL
jgi:predicted nucleic acid-binding Zn ribbon protein